MDSTIHAVKTKKPVILHIALCDVLFIGYYVVSICIDEVVYSIRYGYINKNTHKSKGNV